MLFRSYEVFDMQGLSLRNALSPVVFRFRVFFGSFCVVCCTVVCCTV